MSTGSLVDALFAASNAESMMLRVWQIMDMSTGKAVYGMAVPITVHATEGDIRAALAPWAGKLQAKSATHGMGGGPTYKLPVGNFALHAFLSLYLGAS